MAERLAARPDSQLMLEDLDFFPNSPTPLQQRFGVPLSPPPRIQSHYRPFSSLYSETPYIELERKPSRLKRVSSLSAMQALSSMGISLSGKDKDKSKGKKDLSPQPPSKGSASKMSSLRFMSSRSPTNYDERPSTPLGTSRPSPPAVPMKKKRSMASLFTSTDASFGSGNNGEPNSVRRSPFASYHVSSPPLPMADKGNKTLAANKAVPFKNGNQEDDVDPDFLLLPKNTWSKRNKMTLHPYHHKIPYMQAYNPILLDNDYHTDILLRHLSEGRPSFHDFKKKPPATVLDLGCGQGHWILFAASIWKQSMFTGLDMVDIMLPAFETMENVCFKQGNFLDPHLPFPSKSFEFVRMANLGLCIPRDAWDQLLQEVRRILSPGGRVEIIDDQIHFPYAKVAMSDEPTDKFYDSSTFETDEEDKETLDGETLQGHESADTESTLIGDNSRPSSYGGSSPQLSESPTIRPSDAQSRMEDYFSQTQQPRQKYVVPSARMYASQARRVAVQKQAKTARELEKVFRVMLRGYYGMPFRPADRIAKHLQNIFGEGSAGKKYSFHIKLAPVDSPIGGAADKDTQTTSTTSPMLISDSAYGKKKSWMGSEKDKSMRRRDDKDTWSVDSYASSDTNFTISRNSVERSSLDSSTPLSPAPFSMNAKAAARLGLNMPTTPNNQGAQTPQRTASRRVSLSLQSLPVPSFDKPPVITPPVLTAKAAERLGIMYGPNDGDAISPGLEKPKKRERKKPLSTQSPGILVWPSTYIPMPPSELEMHACKNIHTLLGCKVALGDYIAMQTDADGKRYVSEEEFEDAIWDYECFRRARLNWPSDILDPYDDDPVMPSAQHSFDPIATPKQPKSPMTPPTTTLTTSESFNGKYRREDLTHIRTIRVFFAHKPAPLTGMFRSRSASDTP